MSTTTTGRPTDLRAVVQRKVDEAIERGGATSLDAWDRLKEQNRLMEDHIVPLNKGGRTYFGCGEDVLMIATREDGSEIFAKSMHHHAMTQLGTRLGIPGGWLRDRMSGKMWERLASVSLLNDYAKNSDPVNVLVRSVGGQVRGVLSDRYRVIPTAPVFGSFITQAYAMGAKMYDGELTDLRAFMEVLLPEVVEVPIENGSPIHIVFGSRISSSDFGCGSLELRGFYVQGACLNGMVRRNALRQVHLGKRMDEGMDIYSDETRQRQLETTKLEVADIVKHLLSLPYRQQTVQLIQKAAGMEVDVQREVKALKNVGLLEGEIDEVEAIIARGRYEDGVACGPSAWKVAQGVTAMARDKDAERKRDLEQIASDWLDATLGNIERKLEAQTIPA